MTYELLATITQKSHPTLHKRMVFHGIVFEDILAQIADQAPQEHVYNLKKHMKAIFKDANGVKHSWVLREVDNNNATG